MLDPPKVDNFRRIWHRCDNVFGESLNNIYRQYSSSDYVARTLEKNVDWCLSDPLELVHFVFGESNIGATTFLESLEQHSKHVINPSGSLRDVVHFWRIRLIFFHSNVTYECEILGRIGFVTQDDILFPHLTVRETLTYAARLRLPKKLTKEEKQKRAIDVIYELGLER